LGKIKKFEKISNFQKSKFTKNIFGALALAHWAK
jgi:hypothetical protein